jgi:5,10-methylenetetrahydromethanopterin reductase
MEVTTTGYPELGFYSLPGHALDPTEAIDEITTGERLGLGSVWLSERLNTKNVEVLSGLAAALTERMGIASGLIANLPLRHPLVTAAYASTMAKLTGDRFTLGIGRGVGPLADATGTPRLTLALLEDYVTVMRRLWRGEAFTHDGPAGSFPKLALGAELETLPPVVMGAMGDRTLRWAGGVCDGVVLNSLWSARAVERSVEQVRQGAAEAGRDPDEVTIWTVLVTACEVPEEVWLASIVRRMNTYLLAPGMFEAVCEANGWDASLLPGMREKLAAIDAGSNGGSAIGDEGTTRAEDELRQLAEMYPREWITEGNAVGSAEDCARAVEERFDAGADGILFHGTKPGDLEPLLRVWDGRRGERTLRAAFNPGL